MPATLQPSSMRVKLPSGARGEIPLVGFGTWKSEPGRVREAVKAAIQSGVRHIDCAAVYLNEKEIGEALHECFTSGLVRREDLFITSKLWNTCHAPQDATAACKQSIADLQCGYLDLYLIHWPVAWEFAGLPISEKTLLPRDSTTGRIKFAKVPLHVTWTAMEFLVDAGFCKHIGVSNYTLGDVLDLLTYARIPPAVNQIEVHPYNTRAELIEEMKALGVQVIAYAPLGSGKQGPLQDSTIADMAQKHSCTPAQVICSWLAKQGVCYISKSVHSERIRENTNCNVQLTEEERKHIDGLNRNMLACDMREYWQYPFHPGRTI